MLFGGPPGLDVAGPLGRDAQGQRRCGEVLAHEGVDLETLFQR